MVKGVIPYGRRKNRCQPFKIGFRVWLHKGRVRGVKGLTVDKTYVIMGSTRTSRQHTEGEFQAEKNY